MSEHKLKEAAAIEQAKAEALSEAGAKQKYYLVAGELVYVHADDETQQPVSIRANAIVISNTGKFAVPQLAQAQQALQQGFFQRSGSVEKVTILDVVINNLIPLGTFTKEEFNLPPVGAVQELPPEILAALLQDQDQEDSAN